jgi:hypothetical protein
LRDTVRINDDVVFRELEGEAVLLNLETGVYFGLNEVGTRIWSLLQEGVSLTQVLDQIQDEYTVSAEVLQEDLLRLVEQMLEKGLVRPASGAALPP